MNFTLRKMTEHDLRAVAEVEAGVFTDWYRIYRREPEPLSERTVEALRYAVSLDPDGNLVAVADDGTVYAARCRERLVELDGGVASWHSELVVARLARGSDAFEDVAAVDIDSRMNPWMAPYLGRRRFPTWRSGPGNPPRQRFRPRCRSPTGTA